MSTVTRHVLFELSLFWPRLFFSSETERMSLYFRYGPAVVDYYQLPLEERELEGSNPMCETFPRIASCNYVRYGLGGGQDTKNAICILGLNMINDKV